MKKTRLWRQTCFRIEKETAEHRMLVDLGRNRYWFASSETASVQVTKYMEVELFPLCHAF